VGAPKPPDPRPKPGLPPGPCNVANQLIKRGETME